MDKHHIVLSRKGNVPKTSEAAHQEVVTLPDIASLPVKYLVKGGRCEGMNLVIDPPGIEIREILLDAVPVTGSLCRIWDNEKNFHLGLSIEKRDSCNNFDT
jgi:hypothetical protein